MSFRRIFCVCLCSWVAIVLAPPALRAQASAQSSSSSSSPSSSSKPVRKSASGGASPLDSGTISNSVYRNSAFGFTCKIPAAWVLRTEEMNARDEEGATADSGTTATDGKGGRVLLAAFSRPPEARAEDVNSSILIAAESVAAYPGLKDAAQYFGPVTEIAKAQGFAVVEEPYEFVIGTKRVVRGDFQKDVGSRVMRQSTLVVLARGYAVSFTFIGGTEDEVEELVQGLSFGGGENGAVVRGGNSLQRRLSRQHAWGPSTTHDRLSDDHAPIRMTEYRISPRVRVRGLCWFRRRLFSGRIFSSRLPSFCRRRCRVR